MKRRTCIGISLIILAAFLVWMFRKPKLTLPASEYEAVIQTNARSLVEPIPKQSVSLKEQVPANMFQEEQMQIEQMKRDSDREVALWQGPILYFGKVIDESNQPISGVQVSYSARAMNELREEIHNAGTVSTDEHGIFKIDGVKGVGMMLDFSHPNYYLYPNNLTSFDKRSLPAKGYFSDSEKRAEVFRMHSKGHPVPLVHRADGLNVPLDATPVALNLRGSEYNQFIGKLMVEASGTPPPRYDQQPFDWKLKVNVPDGGLMEYTNQFDFVAPDSGYQPSIEFSFPKDKVGWTDTISKNYFVKLPSGYARLNIYVGAKRPLFFSVEYDYNPDGSKNLERAK